MPYDPRIMAGTMEQAQALAKTQALPAQAVAPAGSWTLPVVGMGNSASSFTGGAPAWSSGSYGYRKPASKGGHVHQGTDIYAQAGTGVVAPVNGVISSIGDGKVSGNYVKVRGDDGYEYYYAHLGSVHDGISRGMRVQAGAYLGGVGNSGNASGTSAHLHFEIRRNGKSVNPNEFYRTGRIQETTPLSAIAGLNTPDEVQAYIDEQVAFAQAQMQLDTAEGFDPSGWGQGQGQTEEERQLERVTKGQSMLGSVLNGMSNTLANGERTPMARMSSALDQGGIPGQGTAPSAVAQREAPIEQEEHKSEGVG